MKRHVLSVVTTPRSLPATRGDCINGVRPCPYVTCRHHLLLDASGGGRIKHNFPVAGDDPFQMPSESCALDVADRGPHTLDEVGALMGSLTRERMRQIQVMAFQRLARLHPELREYLGGWAHPKGDTAIGDSGDDE